MKTLAVALLVFSPVFAQQQAGPPSVPQTSPTIPDHMVYVHVFRHVAKYQELAAQAEANGQPSVLRHAFRKRLNLNPTQEQAMNAIAADCMAQLASVQEKIAPIIAAFRAKYPPDTPLPAHFVPPSSPELAALVAQKHAIVLASVARLQTELGDEEFAKLDTIVKTKIAPEIQVSVIQ